ncbi:MAG: hypothetical protein GWO41_10775, partial [candidate division Zixibacteria bacterium]|nr:hypothetical protein [candidate division Zixibacteria bacterium]NIR64618.1 hypothetical protein [candidate division Zixibacteria bacterium]NIS46477.1 hypothetical protein [candidate division Zixibacteria bacterium]NIT53201.1 hypothetical protein [candidate division Zixibacteria bacterium]NIU14603.1 hypothetical protein [candidate division Zixibacteria bacterium]
MNVKRILWYAARLLSAILVGFYLSIMIGGLIEGEGISNDGESIGMTVLTLFGAAAVIYAWIDARRGGWAIVAIGVAFTIFALVTAGQR